MLSFWSENDSVVVGVDEAGRGCMLGPVFAGAVIWDPAVPFQEIKDSKKLSRKKRAEMREYIESNAIAWGVGSADSGEIDDVNILQATYRAMHRALDAVFEKCAAIDRPIKRLLIDGDKFRPYKCVSHVCEHSADAKYVNVAAASILAKEHHDEWILNRCTEDDVYDLCNNRGYGTRSHLDALRRHGLSEQHRVSFCSKYRS